MPLTEAEREAAFMRYVELSEPYFAAVGAAGDKPWFDSIDERRELFYRRYTRPAPPVGLSIPRFGSVRHAKPLSPTPAIDGHRPGDRSSMKPAEMLKRALVGTQTHTPQPITDDFAKAIARKLEERGIAKVPGIPSPDPEPTWIDNAIEFDRRTKELEAEWEAKHQAELEAATAPKTTAGILANTITGSSSVIPLNGDGILRVVMNAMGGGAANGGNV